LCTEGFCSNDQYQEIGSLPLSESPPAVHSLIAFALARLHEGLCPGNRGFFLLLSLLHLALDSGISHLFRPPRRRNFTRIESLVSIAIVRFTLGETDLGALFEGFLELFVK
jgi:hypothetical protein